MGGKIYHMRKTISRLIILLTLTLVNTPYGFGQDNFAQTFGLMLDGNKKRVQFKFENYNNLIIIPVLLNGVLPVKFILDTGIRTSILADISLSDFLSIDYDRKIPLIGADGSKVIDAYVASNVTIKLPGVTGNGQGMLVLAEDYLQLKNYLGIEVHGIIGYDIFSRFIVKINYDQMTITLYNPKYFKPKNSYKQVPLLIEDTKPYFSANVTLAGDKTLSAKVMMDTGASHSILLDKESHELISIPDRKIYTTLGRGLGGDIVGYIGRVKNVNFLQYDFKQVIGSFPISEQLAELYKISERQGTIGGGILSKFVVIIDYINGKMYFKKGRKFKSSFEYNMSGIDVKAIGSDLSTFVIQNITKDSPAEHIGLKTGDKILYINGHHSKSVKLSDINALFRTKEGRKINVVVLRDGQRLKKIFKLKKVI